MAAINSCPSPRGRSVQVVNQYCSIGDETFINEYFTYIATNVCYDRTENSNQLTSDVNCMKDSRTSKRIEAYQVRKMLDAVHKTSSGAEKGLR